MPGLARAYPRHPPASRCAGPWMRPALAQGRRLAQRGWQHGVPPKAIVALADSERLNDMFTHLLAELRLAFGLLDDPGFCTHPMWTAA